MRTEPFIFLADLEPRAGGTTGVSKTFRIGADGGYQIATETTAGALLSLVAGKTDPDAFFALLPVRDASGSESETRDKPDELADFTPKSLVALFANADGDRFAKSYAQGDAPEWTINLAGAAAALDDGGDAAPAGPGAYLRAQYLPHGDEKTYPPASVFGADGEAPPALLTEAARNEMALLPAGPPGATIRLADGSVLAPGRPAHVVIDHAIYRLQLLELNESLTQGRE